MDHRDISFNILELQSCSCKALLMMRIIVETLILRASAATVKRRISAADNIPASKASRINGLVFLNRKVAWMFRKNSGSSPWVITMACRRDIVAGFSSTGGGEDLVPDARVAEESVEV